MGALSALTGMLREPGAQDNQGLERSCGGFSSKIHAKVDTFALPLEFIITPSQSSDMEKAEELVAQDCCEYFLPDREDDSDPFHQA